MTNQLKAFIILFIFLFVAPAAQMLAYMSLINDWHSDARFTVALLDMLKNKFLPALLPAYSQYMLPSFISGAILSYRSLKGKMISLNSAIITMVICCVSAELLLDGFSWLLGAPYNRSMFFSLLMMMLRHYPSDTIPGRGRMGYLQYWIVCAFCKNGPQFEVCSGKEPALYPI